MGGSEINAIIHTIIIVIFDDFSLTWFYNISMVVGTYCQMHYLTHISLIITSYSIPWRLHFCTISQTHYILSCLSPLLIPFLCLECPPLTSLSGKTLVHWWGSNSDVTCFFLDHSNPPSHSCLWPPSPFFCLYLFSVFITLHSYYLFAGTCTLIFCESL